MGSNFNLSGLNISGSAVAVGDGASATNTSLAQPDRLRDSTMPPDRRVFVVHGRDHEVRTAMFDLLRDLGLEPWEWEEAVADLGQASPYSGDVVVHAMKLARAAVVLLTPDDVVKLHPELYNPNGEAAYETVPAGQARPNVLIELGMVLALYPERTLIAEFGELRPMNDITGRNVIRFAGDLPKAMEKMAGRLANAGCDVKPGANWDRQDRFTSLAAYRRRPV